MKYFIPSLLSVLFAATLSGCGSDDDEFQYQYHTLNLRTDASASLPAGSSGGTSSNTFVVSIDHSGIIRPHHVGKATVEAIGNRTKYTYTVEVTPIKDLYTDLGDCINKNRSEIEQILGAPTSFTGYNYYYPSPKLEKEIQVLYNKDYTMDYAIQTFDKLYSEKILEQLEEYYGFFKFQKEHSVYMNANTLDEATIVVLRNQTDTEERILYMSSNTYRLWAEL